MGLVKPSSSDGSSSERSEDLMSETPPTPLYPEYRGTCYVYDTTAYPEDRASPLPESPAGSPTASRRGNRGLADTPEEFARRSARTAVIPEDTHVSRTRYRLLGAWSYVKIEAPIAIDEDLLPDELSGSLSKTSDLESARGSEPSSPVPIDVGLDDPSRKASVLDSGVSGCSIKDSLKEAAKHQLDTAQSIPTGRRGNGMTAWAASETPMMREKSSSGLLSSPGKRTFSAFKENRDPNESGRDSERRRKRHNNFGPAQPRNSCSTSPLPFIEPPDNYPQLDRLQPSKNSNDLFEEYSRAQDKFMCKPSPQKAKVPSQSIRNPKKRRAEHPIDQSRARTYRKLRQSSGVPKEAWSPTPPRTTPNPYDRRWTDGQCAEICVGHRIFNEQGGGTTQVLPRHLSEAERARFTERCVNAYFSYLERLELQPCDLDTRRPKPWRVLWTMEASERETFKADSAQKGSPVWFQGHGNHLPSQDEVRQRARARNTVRVRDPAADTYSRDPDLKEALRQSALDINGTSTQRTSGPDKPHQSTGAPQNPYKPPGFNARPGTAAVLRTESDDPEYAWRRRASIEYKRGIRPELTKSPFVKQDDYKDGWSQSTRDIIARYGGIEQVKAELSEFDFSDDEWEQFDEEDVDGDEDVTVTQLEGQPDVFGPLF